MIVAAMRISPGDLLRPVIVSGIAVVLSGIRWWVLLSGMGREVPLGRCLYAVLATWPLAVLTPSRSGDVARAALIRREVPLLPGATSVMTEKLLDLQSIGLLLLAMAIWQRHWPLAILALAALVGFWIGIATLPLVRTILARFLNSPRAQSRLDDLFDGLQKLRRHPSKLLAAFSLSVLAWILSFLIIHDLLRATSAGVDPGHLALAWPLSVIAAALPLTISGLGTRDGSLLFLLETFGGHGSFESAAVLTSTLTYPFVTSWLYALAGLPFAMHAAGSLGRGWFARGGLPSHQALIDEEPVKDPHPSDQAVESEGQTGGNGDP